MADSSLSTPSLLLKSPVSFTSRVLPGSSPPSPTAPAVSVKRLAYTMNKVAPKRGAAAKPKRSVDGFYQRPVWYIRPVGNIDLSAEICAEIPEVSVSSIRRRSRYYQNTVE